MFATLAVLLASLAALVVPAWPETRPLLAGTPEPATLAIFRRVLADRPLQTRALLVAVLNVLVFSFYAAGPFMVGDLPAWASAGSAWPSPLPGASAPCSTDACRAPGTALAGYAWA